MPSTIKCGYERRMYSSRGFPGILLHFPETVHLSGERPTGKERVPYITYPCAFDSPQMCELRPSQAESTLWRPRCGWAMRVCCHLQLNRAFGRPILQLSVLGGSGCSRYASAEYTHH